MKRATNIYTFALETEADRSDAEAALAGLSRELGLVHGLRLKGEHRGRITVPGCDSAETWAAIERVVPDWQRIFQPPPKN